VGGSRRCCAGGGCDGREGTSSLEFGVRRLGRRVLDRGLSLRCQLRRWRGDGGVRQVLCVGAHTLLPCAQRIDDFRVRQVQEQEEEAARAGRGGGSDTGVGDFRSPSGGLRQQRAAAAPDHCHQHQRSRDAQRGARSRTRHPGGRCADVCWGF
jgi:hypothetical protein